MRLVAFFALAVLAVTCGPSPDAKLPGFVTSAGGTGSPGRGGTTASGGRTTVGTGGTTVTGSGGTTMTGNGGRMFGSGGVAGAGGVTTGTGGRTTGAGGRTTGTGGTTVGTGGRTTGTGGTTTIPDAAAGGAGGGSDAGTRRDVGVGGADASAGTGGRTGTGGITGTGGTTVGRDAGTPLPDSAGNCLSQVISNGYACGSTPPCSACKDNQTSKTAECQGVLDCLEASYPCTGNCETECFNKNGGNGPVQTCVNALQTAACSGSGC
jgi:hypothetical protein